MSAGYGSGLPDYTGGSGGGSTGDGRGGEPSYGSDPYATDAFATDPYATDAFATDPYAQDPNVQDPYAQDPYSTDQLDADGFGPVFSSSAQAQPGGYAVATYDPAQQYGSQQYGSQQYGAHPSGPLGYGYYPPPLPSSGAGITGFVLGLLALTMCAGLTAPIGIIFAAIGMKETGPAATNRKGGRGITIAGLVMSLVGLIPFLFLVLYFALVIVAIGAGAASS